jgi:hypothetical protein
LVGELERMRRDVGEVDSRVEVESRVRVEVEKEYKLRITQI